MGQNPFSCQNPSSSSEDVLSQQLSLYQWRADTTKNAHIPRVVFKNAFKQKQEEILAEIIGNQKGDGYLEIYKLRDISEGFKRLKNEEIVLFQKYQCSLDELYGTIKISDAFYVLNALLIGFEEIRRIYQEIIVEGSCCFVTIEGEVRAWINPNSKSNDLWMEQGRKIQYEKNVKQILLKILCLAERLTISSYKSQQFFRFLFERINEPSSTKNKPWQFADLRRYIHHFCHENFIQMGSNLKEYFRIVCQRRKVSQLTRENKLKETVMHLSTLQTQCNFNKNRSLLLRSKSLETHFEQNNVQSVRKQNEVVRQQSHSSTFGKELPLNSCIIPQRNVECKPLKLNESQVNTKKQGVINNSSISQTFSYKSPQKSMIHFGKSAFCKKESIRSEYVSQIIEIPSKIVENSSISKLIVIDKPQPQPPKAQQQRKNMQVSIMQNLPPEVPREVRHRTCLQSQQVQPTSQAQMYWSRPWITTKTITKLISEGDDRSVNESIAESSDYYNQSDYNGALSNFARDVAGKDNRSKTVRISRNI